MPKNRRGLKRNRSVERPSLPMQSNEVADQQISVNTVVDVDCLLKEQTKRNHLLCDVDLSNELLNGSKTSVSISSIHTNNELKCAANVSDPCRSSTTGFTSSETADTSRECKSSNACKIEESFSASLVQLPECNLVSEPGSIRSTIEEAPFLCTHKKDTKKEKNSCVEKAKRKTTLRRIDNLEAPESTKKCIKQIKSNDVSQVTLNGTNHKEKGTNIDSQENTNINLYPGCDGNNTVAWDESKPSASEVSNVMSNCLGMKKSYSRLSLKGRKEETVAAIFKQNPSSKPASVNKLTTNGPWKDTENELSESLLLAAAPALVNLGNTCFFNSIIQILFYTPEFPECIARLADEIAATTRDNDTLAILEDNNLPSLTGFACWKFVERLHELFQLMNKAQQRFASGCTDTEAISPTAVLNYLETMNSLFTGGQQQDAHELLRCFLSYIQDSIKLLNSHRSSLLLAIRSDEDKKLSIDIKRVEDVINIDQSSKNCALSKSAKRAKLRRSNEGESDETPPSVNVNRITNFFVRSDRKPKSLLDVPVRTIPVADFIEDLCEGLVERRTRCLECEQITQCTETFQDVEVVVQKTANATSPTQHHEIDGEKCWILQSLEEIERLQGDNKYWCSRCGHHAEAERNVEFRRVPQVLTIQMKRFSAFSSGFFGGFTKTMDCVSVPFEMPCLEQQCRKSLLHSSHRYELFAVVSHTGMSLSSGHYIAYVKSLAETKLISQSTVDDKISSADKCVLEANAGLGPWWYICDDETITAITQTDLQLKLSAGGASTPYLLFYRRFMVTEKNVVLLTCSD